MLTPLTIAFLALAPSEGELPAPEGHPQPQQAELPAPTDPAPAQAPAEAPAKAPAEAPSATSGASAARSRAEHPHYGTAPAYIKSLGHRIYTVHLKPDGTPLSAVPTDVAERDTLRFVVWAPSGGSGAYEIEVSGCAQVDPRRIDSGQGEVAPAQAAPAEQHVPIDLGLELRCGAGTATVSVTPPGKGSGATPVSSFKIDFAPTYALSVAVGMIYDTSPTNTLELTPNNDGTYTIGRSNAQRGLTRTGLLMMHPFGYTPGRLSLGDALLNPTLGLALNEKALQAAYLGNSIAIPGLTGLWLTGGYHLQQTERPTRASGLSLGDKTTSSDPKAIATESLWLGPFRSGGWYLGLSFDLATFNRLNKKQEKQETQDKQASTPKPNSGQAPS